MYFGIKNKKPVYVGITNDLDKRYYQHNYIWNKLYKEDRFDNLLQLNDLVKDGNLLTKDQARGVEQVIIERNREFENQINSISVFNINYLYTLFGEKYLETNMVYNRYKEDGVVN